MHKILYIYPHGLGDLVMATPALKLFKEQNPDISINLAVDKHHGDRGIQLLSGLDFIDSVIPCLGNPWDDFEGGYRRGLQEVFKQGKEQKGFDEYKLIPTARYGTGIELHKIFRVGILKAVLK